MTACETFRTTKMNDRHRGQRLGYLDYHTRVLSERIEELDSELDSIRKEHSGKEMKVKERSALLDFRQDVARRTERIGNQINGVKAHDKEEVVESAERQSESAYRTHQAESKDTLDNGEGFTTATKLMEKSE